MARLLRAIVLTIFVCVLAIAAFPQASTVGQWSGVMTWPSSNSGWVPTHAVLGTDGKVYYWGSYGDGLVTHVFDPATNGVTTKAAPGYNVFCMGHTHLADGRIFTAGGHIDDYEGYIHASIYNSNTNSWTSAPDMNAGRWYPTSTTLANGDVLVVSGTIHGPASSQVFNEVPQVYQAGSNSWRTLSSATLHLQLYPFMFLAPNGKVFLAGWNPDTKYLNTSGTGSWSAVANSIHGWRNYGNAVMYDAGKIILIGGDGDTSTRTPTATAETIDLNATTPAWKSVASMHYARRQQNATLLPDGTILVTGGSSAQGFDVASGAVFPAEIYNPSTNTWTVMASMAKYRGYHSFALLLPDGRVLSGGGQINASGGANGSNAEIYSPPYLFKGTRPTITSAPTSVGYGQTALIGTSDSIARATWIRLSAVTHSFNQEQRFLNLSFSATSGGVNVTFPSSANLSPPGYYMLFLLNSSGVPSVAKIIQISGSPTTTTGTVSGQVTDSATSAAISGAKVSYSGGSTTTDSNGNYTLANVPTGSVSVTASASGYASSSQTVTVNQNAATTANFALTSTPTGTVTGAVTSSSSGAAISGAAVSYSGGSTTTDSTGHYTLSNVPTGTVSVTAAASGFNSSTQSVTVTQNASTTANFALTTATTTTGAIAGKVTNISTGGALSSATVKLASNGATATTDSSGNYKLSNVPTGTQKITVTRSGYLARTVSVTVNSGATTTANVAIATAGKIAATVKTSGGAAISGATVKISGGKIATTVTTTTSSTGTYSSPWIAVGSYTVTVSKSGLTTQSKTTTVNTGATSTVNFTF